MALARELSLWHVVFYGVGLIVGAGIYAVIGEAVGYASYGIWLSFLLAAIISLFTAYSYAELSTAFPKAGGSFYFVEKATGNRLLSFIVGWMMIFQNLVGASAVSLGFAGYLLPLFGFYDYSLLPLFALSGLALATFLTYVNISESTTLNVIFTLVEVGGLLIVISAGLHGVPEVPLWAFDWRGVLFGVGMVYFAYLGYEDIVQLVEETKDPLRNIPRAILLSLLITTVLYVLTALAAVALVSPEDLHSAKNPLAVAIRNRFGPLAASLFSAIPIFSTFNTMVMLLIANARLLYGMAREGFMPGILMKLGKTQTPWIAGLVSGLIAMVFASTGSIRYVAGITDFGTFVAFALVNYSAWIARKKGQITRFRAPIPLNPIWGILTSLIMLVFFESHTIFTSLALIALGLVYYGVFLRAKQG